MGGGEGRKKDRKGKTHILQNGDYFPPQYVFTASELPSFFPIPQHIEMSFLPAPPRKLFFCCLEAPTSTGGETCLCDFKKVYDQMDPKVRQTFEEKGVSECFSYPCSQSQSRTK